MSSQSKSQSSQSSTTNQQDNRAVVDNGGTAITGTGGDVTINQSDMGLISAAFDYFTQKDALTAAATQQLADSAAAGFDKVLTAGSELLQGATQANNTAGQQLSTQYVLLALAALFLLSQNWGKA